MGKADFSGKPKSAFAANDVPEALRDYPNAKTEKPRTQRRLIWLGGISGLAILGLVVGVWYWKTVPQRNSSVSTPVSSSPALPSPAAAIQTDQPDIVIGKAGHFAYPEAPANQLQPITINGQIKLRKAAAKAFLAMQAAARARGVFLVPISGFRSIKDQQNIFFGIKDQRLQTVSQRAEVSAPPGYSEHHTGYAVDVGDGAVPAMNLNPNFDKTAAYKWLVANAPSFNFEMSFPKHNAQGLSYEPWHWRFVGDRDSLETFYKAQKLKIRSRS